MSAMDRALDLFLLAGACVCDGDRTQALEHLREARRAAKASKHPNAAELARELASLMDKVSAAT